MCMDFVRGLLYVDFAKQSAWRLKGRRNMLNCNLINALVDSWGINPVVNAIFKLMAGGASRGTVRTVVESCVANF